MWKKCSQAVSAISRLSILCLSHGCEQRECIAEKSSDKWRVSLRSGRQRRAQECTWRKRFLFVIIFYLVQMRAILYIERVKTLCHVVLSELRTNVRVVAVLLFSLSACVREWSPLLVPIRFAMLNVWQVARVGSVGIVCIVCSMSLFCNIFWSNRPYHISISTRSPLSHYSIVRQRCHFNEEHMYVLVCEKSGKTHSHQCGHSFTPMRITIY